MRKTLFKIHGYLALIALVPILLIALTGSLLVFKFEIDSLLMPDQATISEQGNSRLSTNALVNKINATFTEYEMGSWELFDDGYQADRVYLIKKHSENWYKVFLNPYTAEILSTPQPLNHYLTDWLLELHYTLLMNNLWQDQPDLGTLIGLFVAIILSFLGISGLIIYRRFWRKFFTFSFAKNKQAQNRELHRQGGIWASPVLLIIGLTGVYFNLVEFLHEHEEHENGGHFILTERMYSDNLDFDALLQQSKNTINGFRPTYLLFPFEPDRNVTIFGEVPSMNIFASQYSSTVTFNKNSGELIVARDIRKRGFVDQFVDSLRELHFGNFAGLASKIVYAIVGVGIILSAFTGVLMWLRRKRLIT
ncbi:PepSY-associated TM helix domain-containing protein [Catenovulum sediminis]|uniref:PepSY-associated TM helix domain-containing protein n=1 Tax=Catenovulum sediminis TaxID=1740262 RepID=A0ABV1RKJ8_9ALTE